MSQTRNVMKFIDRTGQTHGRLTVIELAQREKGAVRWRCRCECGNEVVVKSGNLGSGNSTTCGCVKRRKAAERQRARRGVFGDLTGCRFGRYVVLRLVELRKNKPFWLCRCDCGAEKVVMGQSLRTRATVSCGCYHREALAKRATTHGRSGTPAYKRIYKALRVDRENHLDRYWTRRMERLLRQTQQECAICGATSDLVTDHVRPLSRGHGLEPGNAARLCKACNSKKHCKELHELPEDWQNRLKAAAESFKVYWRDVAKETRYATNA